MRDHEYKRHGTLTRWPESTCSAVTSTLRLRAPSQSRIHRVSQGSGRRISGRHRDRDHPRQPFGTRLARDHGLAQTLNRSAILRLVLGGSILLALIGGGPGLGLAALFILSVRTRSGVEQTAPAHTGGIPCSSPCPLWSRRQVQQRLFVVRQDAPGSRDLIGKTG